MLRKGQMLFTYLHLAPDPEQTEALVQVGRDLHRLRDGHRAGRLAAAAHADERSRGPHVDAGRRVLPAEGERRPRHPARRRAGRGAGQGRDPRRRRVGHACGRDGRRPARRRHGRRSLGEAAARTVVDLRRDAAHRVLDAGAHRRAGDGRRPRDRRGADRRRRGAEARHARHGAPHEAGLGARRHLDRPGRLLRDQQGRRRTPTRPTSSTT